MGQDGHVMGRPGSPGLGRVQGHRGLLRTGSGLYCSLAPLSLLEEGALTGEPAAVHRATHKARGPLLVTWGTGLERGWPQCSGQYDA